MRKSIKTIIPDTQHRFCVWHIMEKLPSKLGGLAIHVDDLLATINDIVYNAVTKDHFEMEWGKIIEKNGLQDNNWLQDMYMLHEMWVPIFLRGMFFAGCHLHKKVKASMLS